MVVDGRIGWLGGTGIEDHFNDERFTDVMVRFEGPAVRQLQALFVTGWRHQEGPLDADEATLAALFPPDDGPADGPGGVPCRRCSSTSPAPATSRSARPTSR